MLGLSRLAATPGIFAADLLVALAIGFASAIVPAYAASRVEIVAALRHSG